MSDSLSRSAFLVLLSLSDRPRHGLAIIDRVGETSQGGIRMGPGTLYGTLQKLVAAGLVRQAETPDPDDDDPRRRYYRLTSKGEKSLKAEAAKMQTLVEAAIARRILGPS